MDLIFGRPHRQQERPQPMWLRVLTGAGAILLFCLSVWMTVRVFGVIWTGYAMVPADRQVTVGRLGAFIIGFIALMSAWNHWRFKLYLDPPMRALALTPGSPAQILRVAMRINWLSPEMRGLAVVSLFFYPYFSREFLQFSMLFLWTGWDHLLKFFAALASLVSVMVLKVIIDKLALSIVLLLAGLGLGGGAPRFREVASTGALLFKLAGFTVVPMVCMTIFAGLLGTFSKTLPDSALLRMISSFVPIFNALHDPSTTAHAVLKLFPSVLWFDAVVASTTSAARFQSGALGCMAWLAVGMVMIALTHRRGLSAEASGLWNDVPDAARPAEAVEGPARRTDPDAVSGPIEAWLVRRLGRMGRAALRMVSLNFSAGNIDAHLWRTLKLVPLAVLGGWLLALIFPPALKLLVAPFGYRINPEDSANLSIGAACVWLGVMNAIRLSYWETLEVSGMCNRYTMLRFKLDGGTQTARTLFGLTMPAPSRGDNLQPLTEIFAIGFNDAVLIPVLHTMFWCLLLGGLLLIEGAVLGIPVTWLLWAAGIAVPLYVQMHYFSTLNNLEQCWVDYRRSRLLNVFHIMLKASMLVAALCLVLGVCGVMIYHAAKVEKYWIGWLGCINALILFDIGLFMLMRLIYVRRRFDAELRKQGLFQK